MSQRNNLLLCSQQFVKYKKLKKQQSLQYIHTYNSYTSMETSVVTTIRASNGPWTLEKRRSKEQGFYKPALLLKTPPFFQAPCCYRSDSKSDKTLFAESWMQAGFYEYGNHESMCNPMKTPKKKRNRSIFCSVFLSWRPQCLFTVFLTLPVTVVFWENTEYFISQLKICQN